MLIASQNLTNYGVPVPENTVFRINLAWTNSLDELKNLLQKHKERNIFVDLPIHRTKPPNNKYTLEDIIPIFESNKNVKYLAISNVESSDDLKTLEVSSLILIDYSDQLVHKMGLAIDNSTAMLINFQIFLLGTNVTVHIGMIVLISRIFRNEFELTLQKEKLATVGELSSRLAHDMRNPLSVIQMSTQLLKSKSTEKETSEKLDVIEKGITRMSHQINDVMDFVRTKEPELKLWDVNSILDDCFGRFKLSDSVRLTLPQKSTLVKCDRSQIEILFINLISNSLDSIKNKGSIRVRTQSDEHETKIEFIDSGDGVPEEKLDEIFEPLVTYKESGTGLGLASCKNIVKNHKGTISAKNNPTTFTITLPN